jgi:hypothetical protein
MIRYNSRHRVALEIEAECTRIRRHGGRTLYLRRRVAALPGGAGRIT